MSKGFEIKQTLKSIDYKMGGTDKLQNYFASNISTYKVQKEIFYSNANHVLSLVTYLSRSKDSRTYATKNLNNYLASIMSYF